MKMASEAHIVALGRFRPLFYAAAVYNLSWGTAAVFAPGFLVDLAGLPERSGVLVQGLGLLVLGYAPGFFWAARHPERHAHLVAIALLGKSLAVVGFVWSAEVGTLAPSFGATVISNDAMWVVPFVVYLRRAARANGGWRSLLAGA